MSDYALLEEAKKAVESANRTRVRNYVNPMARKEPIVPDAIPKYRMKLLAREAAKRGIDLRFMPKIYLRHRNNSSDVKPVKLLKDIPQQDRKEQKFDSVEKEILKHDKIMIWCMDIHFYGKDGGTRCVKVTNVEEEQEMKDVLQGALKSLKIKRERTNGAEDPYIDYADVNCEKLAAYLKNEHSLAGRIAQAPIKLPDLPKYNKRRKCDDGVHFSLGQIEFDTRKFASVGIDATVREALYARTIVEYPVIHVAIKGSSEETEILRGTKDVFERPDPDSDIESSSGSGHESEEEEEEDKPEEVVSDAVMTEKGNPSSGETAPSTIALVTNTTRTDGDASNAPKSCIVLEPAEKRGIKRPVSEIEEDGETHSDRRCSTSADEGSVQRTGGKIGFTASRNGTGGKVAKRVKREHASEEPVPLRKDEETEYGSQPPSRSSPRPEDAIRSPEGEGSIHGLSDRESNEANSSDGESDDEESGEDGEKWTLGGQNGKGMKKPVTRNPDGLGDSEPEEREEEEEVKTPATDEGKVGDGSPPIPFAFEYDSALMSTRIPRRKLTNSDGRQTLTC